ncbi:MAG: large-conductance mechanosensitive channel protein MscL [Dysgonamonadaceae bacterium]|jgi:large conductance mechanosensitive channel|nr:large-conductance mechanosensitive channel protein MscL [Dysgonamonadaceae bacterium]
MALRQELKEFMLRGNVIDMAVGIVIGGGFSKIVSSFVNDILMPPISLLLGHTKFSNMKIIFKDAVMEGEKVITPAISWNIGNFIQTVTDFIIIGVSLFLVIRGINQLRRKKEEEPAPEVKPAPTVQESLLMEIRDLLKKN